MLSSPGALSGLNDLMELIILVCEGDFDKKKKYTFRSVKA